MAQTRDYSRLSYSIAFAMGGNHTVEEFEYMGNNYGHDLILVDEGKVRELGRNINILRRDPMSYRCVVSAKEYQHAREAYYYDQQMRERKQVYERMAYHDAGAIPNFWGPSYADMIIGQAPDKIVYDDLAKLDYANTVAKDSGMTLTAKNIADAINKLCKKPEATPDPKTKKHSANIRKLYWARQIKNNENRQTS